MNTKVVSIKDDTIHFDNGMTLSHYHEGDCCEHHYLDFEHIKVGDFEGMEFDLSGESFFTPIPDYGISLNPIKGHPVRIPGYGYNNGYYSTNLTLILKDSEGKATNFDIEDCQVINE